VHSLLPVANIGYELGFSEPTNFVKFFHRETRLTPGAFRAQMLRGTATGGHAAPPARSGGLRNRR
jgi:AraC-like DNA-binding protein